MRQEEINEMLAAALDEAQARLEVQEQRMQSQEDFNGLLVDQIEKLTYRINAAVKEAETARLHYADQRKRLGLTVDLSGGSLIGGGFGLPEG